MAQYLPTPDPGSQTLIFSRKEGTRISIRHYVTRGTTLPQTQNYLFMRTKYLPLIVVSTSLIFMTAAFVMPLPSDTSLHSTMPNDDGEEVYITRCLSCHMTNGEGVPGVFPPIAESEYVSGDKGRLIRMVLNGLGGKIEVNGTTYSGIMPPWGGFLDDDQMAQVLTYIRTNFGNEGDAVLAEEVARIRESTKDRTEVWTIEELNKEENLGIPEGD